MPDSNLTVTEINMCTLLQLEALSGNNFSYIKPASVYSHLESCLQMLLCAKLGTWDSISGKDLDQNLQKKCFK